MKQDTMELYKPDDQAPDDLALPEEQPEEELEFVNLDLLDKAIPALGLLLILVMLVTSCALLPVGSYNVMSNTTVASQCVAQNYAQMATTRWVSDLQDTVQRNAHMLKNNVVSPLSVDALSL